MSLHLGNDIVISSKQLLAILNLNKLAADSGLLKHLKSRQGTQRVRVIGSGRSASAVLCNRGTFYLSPIEATTLARRACSLGHYRKRAAQKQQPVLTNSQTKPDELSL